MLLESESAELVEIMVRGLRLLKRAGTWQYPKNHACVHLAMSMRSMGALTSTDRDESFNKVVKKVYRSIKLGSARLLTKLWLRGHARNL
jgi:hypothetical protein